MFNRLDICLAKIKNERAIITLSEPAPVSMKDDSDNAAAHTCFLPISNPFNFFLKIKNDAYSPVTDIASVITPMRAPAAESSKM